MCPAQHVSAPSWYCQCLCWRHSFQEAPGVSSATIKGLLSNHTVCVEVQRPHPVMLLPCRCQPAHSPGPHPPPAARPSLARQQRLPPAAPGRARGTCYGPDTAQGHHSPWELHGCQPSSWPPPSAPAARSSQPHQRAQVAGDNQQRPACRRSSLVDTCCPVTGRHRQPQAGAAPCMVLPPAVYEHTTPHQQLCTRPHVSHVRQWSRVRGEGSTDATGSAAAGVVDEPQVPELMLAHLLPQVWQPLCCVVLWWGRPCCGPV
jgi:hypothetical protein